MILMALDHTRDYFHDYHKSGNNALDLGSTNELIFFTRWITHFCAPAFVFLAGTSVFLYGARGRSKNETAIFLFSRGLWLIICEFTIVGFAWTFSFHVPRILLGVIWVIGASMILLSLLIYLPKIILLITGLAVVFLHNSFDLYNSDSVLWTILHQPREFIAFGDRRVVALYSLLPWLGLMISGYFLGYVYDRNFDKRKRKILLLSLGSACIILFLILRAGNIYGDANQWREQNNFMFSLMSFVNTTKYPPSLLYMLMTIGPCMILLALTDSISNSFSRIITVYGRVPFFYYILHLFLIHGSIWLFYILGGNSAERLDFFSRNFNTPSDLSYGIGIVYVVWIAIVALLYFPCKWFNDYKDTHKSWWLSYV